MVANQLGHASTRAAEENYAHFSPSTIPLASLACQRCNALISQSFLPGRPRWASVLLWGHQQAAPLPILPERPGYSGWIMSRELKGRSAVLQAEIDRLEREAKRFATSGIPEPVDVREERSRLLTKLRDELKVELETKRVVVIGTDHAIQKTGHLKNPELRSRLLYLIEQFAVTTLMEEWAEKQGPSVASEVAKGFIAYKNVGTPPGAAFQTFRYAPIDHPAHDGTLAPSWDGPSINEYGPLDRQERREQRMIENILSEMEGHSVGLFIVGHAHLHSMSLKLKEAHFNVTAYSWLG